MLLESIVAIALITVLMVALTALFISAMQTTAHQRATQGAVRLATDEVDQARGLGAAGALSGRDQASVQAQFAAAPATVTSWLSTVGVQAFSSTAASGAGTITCAAGAAAGTCAELPTVPVSRSINNTAYGINYYEQWCHLDASDGSSGDSSGGSGGDSAGATADGTPDCADTAVGTDTSLRQYLRVVVAITWTDSSCPNGGCSYVTSVMLSVDADPMFYFRNPPPPPPKISGTCGNQALPGYLDDSVDLDIVGSDGMCAFSGGVPPITWAGTGLPDGLAVIAAGNISGTLSKVGTYTVTLTATDAFLRTTSATFTWTVSYHDLVAQNPGAQTSTASAALTSPLTVNVSGGSGSAVLTDPTGSLPPGLAVQGDTVTGTPTAAGTFTVALTATDTAAGSSVSVPPFTWTVNPPPAVTPPPNTTTAPGGTVTGQATGSAGTPPYTFALQNAPSWLTIDSKTGALSGTAGSEIADYPGIVVKLTDSQGAVALSAPFTWSVYDIPTLVPPGDQTSDLGQSISLQLEYTCAEKPCTVAIQGNPSWLTMNSDGLITGVAPGIGGLFKNITVSVTDARSTVAASEFSWLVGPQQTIATPNDQVWTVGQPMTDANGLQIAAACTAQPCSFALLPGSGPLPGGLVLNSGSGLITGTPSTAGTFGNIQVMITNANGKAAATAPFTWTINPAPTLNAVPNQRTALNGAASVSLQAGTCLSTPCTFAATTTLPAGLQIDPNTGVISGTVTAAGVTPVTVALTDKTGASASRSFIWFVLGISVPDQAVRISSSQGNGTCKNDSVTTLNLSNDVSGYSSTGKLSFAAGAASPAWVSVSGSMMTITAPCAAGSYAATVTVTDSGGPTPGTATTTFTIKVS